MRSRIAVGFTTIAEHSMNIGVELLAKGISSLSESLLNCWPPVGFRGWHKDEQKTFCAPDSNTCTESPNSIIIIIAVCYQP